jgi:hypothetical protein
MHSTGIRWPHSDINQRPFDARYALCVVNSGSGNDQTFEVTVGNAISEEYIRRSLRQVASRRSHSEFSHIYLLLRINWIDAGSVD